MKSGILALPRTVKVVFAGNLLSSIGSGMGAPFVSLFLTTSVGLSMGWTGTLMGLMAVGFVVSLSVGGHLSDRFPPYRILVLSLVCSALAYTGLAFSTSPVAAAVSLLCIGMSGFGGSSMTKMLVPMVEPRERPTLFGARYLIANVGLGAGTALGGVIATWWGYTCAFLVNAGSTLVYLAIVIALRRRLASPAADHEGEGHAPRGYMRIVRDRRFLPLAVGVVLVSAAGFSQLESGVPMLTTRYPHVSAAAVGLAWTANTIMIGVIQVPMIAVIKRIGNKAAIIVGSAFFACSWIVLYAGLSLGLPGALTMCASFVVFAVGETLFMPASSSLVNDLSDYEHRGRYNAALDTLHAAGDMIGPLAAGFVLSGAPIIWVVTMVGLLIIALAAFTRTRVPTPQS